MQSPGPSYQGPNIGVENYSNRPYDNGFNPQINSHQVNSFISYQENHQSRYLDSSYNSGGAVPESQYPSSEIYSNTNSYSCGGVYEESNRHCYNRGLSGGSKPYWSEHGMGQNSGQYNRMHMPNVGSHMPPPPLRSPPQSGNGYVNPSPRQTASPHNWPHSPGVMHSPRATPSPLHKTPRSPFSPPPPPPLTTMAQNKSVVGAPNNSPSMNPGGPGASPLQSLQKMVMVDQDSSDSSISRGSYDTPHIGSTPPSGGSICSQKTMGSHEQSTHDSESPYPTYYNLDQNRLCTPPRSSPISSGSIPYNQPTIAAEVQNTKCSQQMSSSANNVELNKATKGPQNSFTESKVSGSKDENSVTGVKENGSSTNESENSPLKEASPTNVASNNSNVSVPTSNSPRSKMPPDISGSYYPSDATPYPHIVKQEWNKNSVTITSDGRHSWTSSKSYYPQNVPSNSQSFHGVNYQIPPPPQQGNIASQQQQQQHHPQHNMFGNWAGTSGASLSNQCTPVKKKRGRPHGSKNKPKPMPQIKYEDSSMIPSSTSLLKEHIIEIKSPRKYVKKLQKCEIGVNTSLSLDAQSTELLMVQPPNYPTSSSSSFITTITTTSNTTNPPPSSLIKKNNGPLVHVEKNHKKQGYSYSIVNMQKKVEDDKVSKKQKLIVESCLGSASNRRHSLTKKKLMSLSQQINPIDRDISWVCVLCKQGPHYKGLGDLFGPYFVGSPNSDENKAEELDEYRLRQNSERRKRWDISEASKGGSLKGSADNKGKDEIESNKLTQNSQIEGWFHEDCIVWSSGVYLIAHRIRNIDEIVKDSAETICCSCKLGGATLGCLFKGCLLRFHYLCAKEKGCIMKEENFSIYCSKHKGKYS